MMIESLAGKSATLHGLTHDATPFIFSEDQPAYSFYGELLHRGKLPKACFCMPFDSSELAVGHFMDDL